MTQDTSALYNAYASRDARFDGVFYIGVTSTGIYCRPVCAARTPKEANCRFFDSAAEAEKANFRPCLRCRPELAPGNAPVDNAARIAALIAQRIDEGMLDDGAGIARIAREFGWSSRQIRRIAHRELGVSPMELLQTRRLLLAKQLLTETALPITEIAFASGFSSLRRFNDAFGIRYGMPPTHFRRAAGGASGAGAVPETLSLRLSYRPPFDWAGTLRFLDARATRGVEWVDGDAYLRAAQLGGHRGWIRVRHAPEQRGLAVDVTHSLVPALPALLGRLRHLFDLSARPDIVAAQLGQAAIFAEPVARNAGLRVPGAFDGFELAVRAVLGQQITVKAATTLAGRFAEAFGVPITTPHAALNRLTPTAQRVALASVSEVASLGIIRVRAQGIVSLAQAMVGGEITLEPGADPQPTMERLVALPGIGRWTAAYIGMRALRWPDAFLYGDVALRKALGGVTAARAEEMSQAWRPWRSYATLHLWALNANVSSDRKADASGRRRSPAVRPAPLPGGATPTPRRRPVRRG